MRKGVIYKATNIKNRKPYIGITIIGLNKRINNHYNDSKRFTHKFANALKKYKKEYWEWKILYDNVPENQLGNMERWCIIIYDSYNNGYNSTEGGDISPMNSPEIRAKVSKALSGKNNPMYGKTHTKKARKKISNNTKGLSRTKEVRDKISHSQMGNNNSFYGERHTKKSKDKMKSKRAKRVGKLSPNYGKHWSNEMKNKISLSLIGRKRGPMPEEQKKKISKSKKGSIPWNKGKHK